jgi:hypothetical protein
MRIYYKQELLVVPQPSSFSLRLSSYLIGSNNIDLKVPSLCSAKAWNCHNVWQQNSPQSHIFSTKTFLRGPKFLCALQ